TPTLGEFAPRFLEVEHQHHDVLTDCNDGLQAFRRLVYNQQFITTPECKRMKGISLGVGVLSVLFLASTANAQCASLGKGWIVAGSGSITSAPGEVISGRNSIKAVGVSVYPLVSYFLQSDPTYVRLLRNQSYTITWSYRIVTASEGGFGYG